MQFQQLLVFKSKDQLPKEFLCKICLQICNNPILKTEYIEEEIYCDDDIHNLNSELSSQLQTKIRFSCDLCGKIINFLHFKNHFQKCNYLIKNGSLIQDFFEEVQPYQKELLCQICNKISYLPQNQDLGVVCIFCRQISPLKSYRDMKPKQKDSYSKIELECKQCKQKIQIDQLLIHFKKCLNNKIPLTEESQILQDRKIFRQKIKKSLKVFDLSIEKMIKMNYDTGSSEYQISFQMKQVNNQQKKVDKLAKRMKIIQEE